MLLRLSEPSKYFSSEEVSYASHTSTRRSRSPWRVEFPDGEIILVKREDRAHLIAELVPGAEKLYGLGQKWLDSQIGLRKSE